MHAHIGGAAHLGEDRIRGVESLEDKTLYDWVSQVLMH
jgi:hypothetical protein